ncbi:MAG: ABC transporter permease subunit [Pseudomonadota bacterium]
MGAYILRRLLLIIPTLLGILLLNFAIIQFLPGGPVEQQIMEIEEGSKSGSTDRFTGGGDGGGANQSANLSESGYRGRRGIDPDLIADLEAQYGFARIVCEDGYEGPQTAAAEECVKEPIPTYEQFGIMLVNYVQFDFGESFRRSISVIDVILEKMPVSISLGLWATLISYLVSIPLGVRKAVRDGSRFDTVTSGIIVAAYSLPAFLVPVVLLVFFAGGSYWQIFPLRGLHSEGWEDFTFWEQVIDYAHHITLPVIAMTISSFATLTLLTKNSFLDEVRKQYVLTARSKGLSERKVLYGHVFRNAMLIVIAGFPAAFVSVFFTGSIFVETVFNLDGLGLLAFESIVNRDYPVVMGSLFIFGILGLVMNLISDLVYVWIDPRIDFEKREG